MWKKIKRILNKSGYKYKILYYVTEKGIIEIEFWLKDNELEFNFISSEKNVDIITNINTYQSYLI